MKVLTQILLEAQHEIYLRSEAKARNLSVSAVLRSILDERMARRSDLAAGDTLDALAGSARGKNEHGGRNPEDILYGSGSQTCRQSIPRYAPHTNSFCHSV